MAQDEDLDVLRGVGADAQRHPGQQLRKHQVHQLQRHRRIMPSSLQRQSSRSTAASTISGTYSTVCARGRHGVRTLRRWACGTRTRRRASAHAVLRCASTQPCTPSANLLGLARALAVAIAEVRMVWVPGTDYPPAQQHVGYPVSVLAPVATLYGSSTVAAAVLRHGAGTDEAGGHL